MNDVCCAAVPACEEKQFERKYYWNPDHLINIKKLDIGYVVSVGCQSIAIKSQEELLSHLNAFITNPGVYYKAHDTGRLAEKFSE